MKVTIDGKEIDVPEGTTILQAARMIGADVARPAMCHYSRLKTSGGYCITVKMIQGITANPTLIPMRHFKYEFLEIARNKKLVDVSHYNRLNKILN